ncbi:glutathione S-transferase [Candidatus Pelagibacter sp.]|nr:glutathione S-transferase [Candidatus Pelagibacter sp.]
MKHKLELIYFKMRALAEAPRLLLHYTKLEYDDIMSWDYYGKEWSEIKSKVPFRQLPMLVVDQKHEICQSIAILIFIEKITGINISDPILNAKANAVMQSAQELFMPLNPTINFAVGDSFNKKREDMMPFLNSRFEDLERALKDNDEKFYVDDEPHACDFAVYHHLDLSKLLDPKLISKFPRLEKFIDDIESIETVKSYLNSRPQLIDVGVEPKLVIDGVAHPTGVKKT